MPYYQWLMTWSIAKHFGLDPKLLVAIGWHETHWGRLGAGRSDGWPLGYAYFPGSTIKDHYKSLPSQLAAVSRFIQKGYPTYTSLSFEGLLEFSRKIWRAGDPDNWAKRVWEYYQQIEDDYSTYSFTATSECEITVKVL
jgi:hypothetical protein